MPNGIFQAFAQALEREGRRPLTVANYLSDLKGFATWFTNTS